MLDWFEFGTHPLLGRTIASLVVSLIIYELYRWLSYHLKRRSRLSIHARRRWLVRSRNGAILLLAALLVVIWFAQLRSVATGVVVLAVAIVIAIRELLSNMLGFVMRSSTHQFQIGDRIELDGMRGDVIDHGLMGTTMLEIGPGQASHQYTGRYVFVPNSHLLSHPLINETFSEEFVFHTIIVPIEAGEDWEMHETALLSAAETVCSPYLDEARANMREMEARHSLDAPRADPRVNLHLPEPGEIHLMLRVPIPVRRRGRLEQAVLRQYLHNVRRMRARPQTDEA